MKNQRKTRKNYKNYKKYKNQPSADQDDQSSLPTRRPEESEFLKFLQVLEFLEFLEFSFVFSLNGDFGSNFLIVFLKDPLKHKVSEPPVQFPYCFLQGRPWNLMF